MKKVTDGLHGSISVQVKVTVSPQQIQDLLTNAFEFGIGYWAKLVRYDDSGPGYLPREMVHFHDGGQMPRYCWVPLTENGAVVLRECEEDDSDELRLDRAALLRGFQVLSEKYPKHMSDILDHNDDAWTADALVQCAVLGDILFG